MDQRAIQRHLRRQDGVISRRQVLAAGGTDLDIARLVRRRVWAPFHEGVYVDHTGPPTRRQREWAAVLVHHPAALAGRSALRAHGLDADAEPDGRTVVEVAVAHGRRVRDPAGVRTIQVRDLGAKALMDASPPRLKLEPAVLMVASSAPRDDAAVAVLADAVRCGKTTPPRLRAALDELDRLPGRRLLGEALADVAVGAQSPLEVRYLRDVERAHGLPSGSRQVREVVRVVEGEVLRVVYRDVRYRDHAALVELDGQLGHAAAKDGWADLDRDLGAAVRGDLTLRAGWQQVLDPCRLAVVVGAVLATRGWHASPVSCARTGCVARPERIA
jgi:hypothetical protein